MCLGVLSLRNSRICKKLNFFSKIELLRAEMEGFEPPVPRSTTVFKTAAFDHSATSPRQK